MRRRFNQVAVLLVVVSVFAGAGFCAELLVPSEYVTVQAAVDAANNGDVILLAEGVYKGEGNYNILIDKDIEIRGEAGAEKCILDGVEVDSVYYKAFYFRSPSQAKVRGLSFRHFYKYVILDKSDGVEISDCVFESNINQHSSYDELIYIENANTKITNCRFENNQSYTAVSVRDSENVVLEGCCFKSNYNCAGLQTYNSRITINNCDFDGDKLDIQYGVLNVSGSVFHNVSSAIMISPDVMNISSSTFENIRFDRYTSGEAMLTFSCTGNSYLRCMTPSVVDSCVFRNCKGDDRGAIQVTNSCGLNFINCLFEYNSIIGDYVSRGMLVADNCDELKFVDCCFNGNRSSRKGGALDAIGSDLKLVRCVFQNNQGGFGDGQRGGAVALDNCNYSIESCEAVGNKACSGGAFSFNACAGSILDSKFSYNQADSSEGNGGALYYMDSERENRIENCILNGNQAWRGGGIYNDSAGQTISRTQILGNNAGSGAAVWMANGEIKMDRCEISRNCGGSSIILTFGGSFENEEINMKNCYVRDNNCISERSWLIRSNDLEIHNCTFVSNSSDKLFREYCKRYVYNSIFVDTVVDNYDTGELYYVNCCFDMNSDIDFAYYPTCFKADAMLAEDGLHLLPGSPCIDAGAGDAQSGEFDIDGDLRVIGDSIDIGADEFGMLCDLTFDGVVNYNDYVKLANGWVDGVTEETKLADFSGDGKIDFDDVIMFADSWLGTH